MKSFPARRLRLATLAIALVATASACSGDIDEGPAVALEPAPAEQQLAGACPATVVVQLQWAPETDSGPIFGLLGPGYRVDADNNKITGPLVADGKDTGVELEIRAGGPAIGFQTVPSQMYVDQSITLGLAHSEHAIAAAGQQPIVAVTTLLRNSPQMLMWDPKTNPGWQDIADIGRSGKPIVVSKGQLYPNWLVARGLVKQDQIDASYDNSPSRFVTDPSFAQQGFANAEPYTYEHEVRAWNKPVAYQLLKDVGYEGYARTVNVRADKLAELRPCLQKLVPMIQQATARFRADPAHVNDVVVDVVEQNPKLSPYSPELAAFGSKALIDGGLIGNDTDGVLGSFDEARVQRIIDEFGPILRTGGADVPAGLTAKDLVTKEFLDPSISVTG
ncbi:nitrate ABC transporter substrate-binding protein [Nocardia neocaledoniensis NBRC 108232]|uniref:ABC-type nitrate/sulfonate/bicarbonate transport system substrate-binding protein n=1 Tax=Nocardia neocaledoniensis TaxID=236511 RepID=A0A317NF55_9NOCA|nr:ABC transporter substrate-binding protein [Nocardia neocaledoniensis]PWV73732.1 ABC-type nitrate/sulfonate/bicarbonate transport system substrate-binding protein [Nocardia neocaledoniensis]GEM29718.1 nitrate ABC transporter substrate-binding protein [Nocardia neocaledoniensis NBRC 108232]